MKRNRSFLSHILSSEQLQILHIFFFSDRGEIKQLLYSYTIVHSLSQEWKNTLKMESRWVFSTSSFFFCTRINRLHPPFSALKKAIIYISSKGILRAGDLLEVSFGACTSCMPLHFLLSGLTKLSYFPTVPQQPWHPTFPFHRCSLGKLCRFLGCCCWLGSDKAEEENRGQHQRSWWGQGRRSRVCLFRDTWEMQNVREEDKCSTK